LLGAHGLLDKPKISGKQRLDRSQPTFYLLQPIVF
jgi:hypothetical protein